MSYSASHLPHGWHQKYGDCARGCSDPIEASEIVKAFNDTEIMAIYSGTRASGRNTLYAMSSCVDYNMTVDDRDRCDYFTQVDDFPDLRHSIKNLTEGIVAEVSKTHVQCVKG